jgi:hypothetical protein
MEPNGTTRTIAKFPDGPNPIAAIPTTTASRTTGAPPPGLYVTNDINPYVYFVPASQLASYGGSLIVGTEEKAQFWIIRPHGQGFERLRLRTTLRGGHYSLEDCIFIR